jgi:phosphoribosyl-AMP cyclohydrolase
VSETIETTQALCLRYGPDGLIPAIAQDVTTGKVLMLAWMNAEAVAETCASGRATYWSRSRGRLWRKGESSGHVQRVVKMLVDCDQDSLLLLVEQTGPACHTGAESCFYRAVTREAALVWEEQGETER